ncbi:hypothetical protein I302_106472 [Kwoniella bestiolae CBS 10118]|uniref:Uncharacterized protein n=1 Tax=Kwoniella bestiolae CBS 10118 TaxID=1296100 RepID=A0A1B9G1C1_9TREE|nr:hypothetical protein I302_06271 [Kwoniella bestiolae CBS 10118]OCF24810.1 hypothetical protein I302_06271 [Kwoniella bestiolae CBS 10118]
MAETTDHPADTKYLQIPKATDNGQTRSGSPTSTSASGGGGTSSTANGSSRGLSSGARSPSRRNLNMGFHIVEGQSQRDRVPQEGGGTVVRETDISEDCLHLFTFACCGPFSANSLRALTWGRASSNQATEMNSSGTVSRGWQSQYQSPRIEYGDNPDG